MEQFPIEDVIASQEDRDLQAQHPWQCEPLEQREWMIRLRADAVAEGASTSTHWIYFRGPPSTWRSECGTEGWLLVDYLSVTQLNYLVRSMS
jgi:hypothetical protein